MKRYTCRGYVLTLCDTGKRDADYGKHIVSYRLVAPDKTEIFAGSDFHVPFHDCESKRAAGELLGFLLLQEGDTDSDYFSTYTPRQWEFSRNEAENLFDWRERLENSK